MALSSIDSVRLEIGDSDAVLFTDDQVSYFIENSASILYAAANACDSLAARFAAGIDFTSDTLAIKKLARSDIMAKRADSLRLRAEGIGELTQTKVDGYSQDLDNLDTNEIPLNIDPDIPRFGPAWENDLARQQGENFVPGHE